MQHNTNRRRFLTQLAGAAGAATIGAMPFSVNSLQAGDEKQPPAADEHLPIIDPHQHLWDLDKIKLSWLENPGSETLNRSYVTSDYVEATKGLNVVKAVYMEVDCNVEFQEREAQYALDLCRRGGTPTVGAIIGGHPNSAGFARYIDKFAADPPIKGVRQILHVESAPRGLCLEPRFVENVKRLGEIGLRFELCMRPGELLDGVKLVDQCPNTKFVLDHCGNMSVQSTDKTLRETWMKGIRELAERPNTVCKISGIIVTADKKNWKPADLAPNMNYCMDTFGEDRIMFAGDWPVCTLTAAYRQWVHALDEIVRDRPESFRRKLYHDNAAKFYDV